MDELISDLGESPTGAQIEVLCKEAAMHAIRRFMTNEVQNRFGTSKSVSRNAMKTLLAEQPFQIIKSDFEKAKRSIGKSFDEKNMDSYLFAKKRGLTHKES